MKTIMHPWDDGALCFSGVPTESFYFDVEAHVELTAGHHYSGLYNSRDGVIVKACWAFAPDIPNEVEDDEEYALRSLG